MSKILGIATIAAFMGTGTFAAEPTQEVTVTAQRAELLPKLSAFAYGITEPVNGEGIARWHAPVCPLVAGLTQPEGEFILARISEIARAAGVPLAGEQCRPNLYIMVTGKPQQLLQAMANRKRDVVFANATPLAVDEFIGRPEPVKVWYSTARTIPGGAAPVMGMPAAAQVRGGGLSGPPVNAGSWLDNSHLQSSYEFDFSYVFVVADQARLGALTRGQFADYLAMVGLAEVRSPPHLGEAQTILKLFDGAPDAALAGLSSWDQAFLKALYHTNSATKTQRSQLGVAMSHELAP
ncbi:MAG TPA: hypothetical protein VK700_00920 [Steroidobacteraceae bacterium]|jgi:hypothetical protein|nr:hypothetical protein [Steroidobacteraceae bacterium]